MRAVVLVSAVVLTAACSYEFQNPAEVLRAGEVRGRVLSDAGAGVAPNPGVSVSLRNSDLTQLSRDTGLFVVVPLPEGRHTLLFRKGTTWAIEREVEIRLGSDGQPEGVSIGDVVLRYSAAVEGIVSLPSSAPPLLGGTVVDETTGLTSELAGPGFGFPVLSTGVHRLRVAAEDQLGGRWVGGPVDVELTDDLQQQAVQLSPLALRPSSGQGVLRFQVQGVGGTVDPASVTVTGLPLAVTPGPGGVVEVTLPEGRYDVGLATPPAGGVVVSPVHGPVASLALALPELVPPTLKVTVVVLADRPLDAGPIYLVAPEAASEAALGCASSADCACYDPSCTAGGTCGPEGLCEGWTPPPAVPATIPFCDLSQEQPVCTKGAGNCGADEYCAVLGASASGYCVPCGYACTVDGILATAPDATECTIQLLTVTGRVSAIYLAEDGSAEVGVTRAGPQTAIAAVPVAAVTPIPGTFDPATGDYTIPGVPSGTFMLSVDGRAGGGTLEFYEVPPGDTRDVLTYLAGRLAAVKAGLSTPVTLELTGLVPWSPSDRFTLVSAGAGLSLDRIDPLIAGASTTASPVLDLLGLGLPDGATDAVYAAQLVTTSFSGAPAGTVVLDAQAVATVTGFSVADGLPATLPLALQGGAGAGFLSLSLDEAPWLALAADLSPSATPMNFDLRIHGVPHAIPLGVDATMWQARIPTGSGAFAVAADFGRYLGGVYSELAGVHYAWTSTVNATGASPRALEISTGTEQLAGDLQAGAAPVPVVGPPRALTIMLQDGYQRRTGVGMTPTLGWDPPSVGAPSHYEIELVQVLNSGGVTSFERVAGFRVLPDRRSLNIPLGVLDPAGEYVALVSAVQSPNDLPTGVVVHGWDLPLHRATNVTAVFSPR